MWTYIKQQDFDNYIDQYPQLSEDPNQLKLFETNDAIFVPRLLTQNFPSQYLISYPGKRQVKPIKTKLKFHGTLRKVQTDAANVVERIYKQQGYCNGIIKIPPGRGKTVLTVYLAAMMGVKTCIIVDNSVLMKQWIDAFMKFGKLTVDDIGIVKQKLFVTNKPVSIAMAQTLLAKIKNQRERAFKEVDNAGFGLVVYDEVHATSASEMFSKVSVLFRTPNVIGLSATPFQYALAEILMHNTVGKVIYESNAYEMLPEYYIVYYDSGLGKKYNYMLHKLNDYIQKKAVYNSLTVKSAAYPKLVAQYTKNLKNNGHNVLIICMTQKQVELISETLTKDGVENRQFYGKSREIDKANDNIVVATYSFCGKGFDMPRLSALILACPLSGKKSLIQTVGRVLRDCDGKIQPVVVDMVDLAFPMLSMPDVKRKKNVISGEFTNCKIVEYNEKRDVY